MLDQFRGVSLVAATIAMGLAAGLYYAYACSVMLGLGRAGDRTFVEGMQKINVAILNGWFFLTFIGALLLTAVAALLHVRADGGRAAFAWILAALVLYVVVLVVTMGFNVPLNNRLEAAGDPARITDLAAVREEFEAAWVRWNVVRTLACTAAFGCLTWALVLYGRSGG